MSTSVNDIQLLSRSIENVVLEDIENDKSVEIRPTDRCVLEDFKPCSKSHLWKLMMSFYDRKGPESWSQGIVPHFITCNSFIGRSYAKVLHGFIRDCFNPQNPMSLDINEPLYIIELGAGSGKFSFYMLKALEEMKDVCDFPLDKIVYVMTDFTENNFNFWCNHSSLKKYFDSGRLDAGIFDAVEDYSIKLWRSGKVLNENSSKNPICIVANYLFDTLYHDIFQVSNGELYEGLVSVGSKNAEEPDPLHPDIIQRLENQYKYEVCSSSYYNSEEGDEIHLERILNWYKNYFHNSASGASILIPIGALRALRRLGKISNGKALVISGDKGNNNPDQFAGLADPHIAVHGSFSLMVNYHAIGAWFTSKGGFALHNPQEEASLKVSCFLLDSKREDELTEEATYLRDHQMNAAQVDTEEVNLTANIKKSEAGITSNGSLIDWTGETFNNLDTKRSSLFPYLKQAFHDSIHSFGPNDFFVLQKSLKEDLTNPPLRTVVALLKLGDWDPDVFFKFRDTILNHAPTSGQKLRNDLCRGMPRVWENYYIMDMEKDIAFEIGRFYYGIREYILALKYYLISKETVGDHHVTCHNQGLCYYSQGHLETSLEYFKRALELNPSYEKARSWIEKTTKEIMQNNINVTEPSASVQPSETEYSNDSTPTGIVESSDPQILPPPDSYSETRNITEFGKNEPSAMPQ